MPDELSWEMALDADPDDQSLRTIYADWLEECDRTDLAVLQRFLAAYRLLPMWETARDGITRYGWLATTAGGWQERSKLPEPVSGALGCRHWPYPSRVAAERALLTVIEEVRELLLLKGQ